MSAPKRKPEDDFVTKKHPSENVNIPSFVSKVPWYMQNGDKGSASSSSKSGSVGLESSTLQIMKGSVGDVKSKFIPGSCENCGSTSHKRRDCLERPRKILAKYSGEKLASDDVNPDDVVDRGTFEGKRDRWRGYTAGDQPVEAEDKSGEISQVPLPIERMVQPEKDAPESLRQRTDTVKYLLDLEGTGDKEYDPKSRALIDKKTESGFEKDEDSGVKKHFAWEHR